jgi:hypothetical protein
MATPAQPAIALIWTKAVTITNSSSESNPERPHRGSGLLPYRGELAR